ncbi:MAG: DUF935 family protein [Alphaproteobacteria bacterium]
MAHKPEEQGGKPELGEVASISKADHSLGFTTQLQTDDTVLKGRGGDYKLYDEVLRDEQVASCLQQRRSGLSARPWDVVAGADDKQSQMAADAMKDALNHVGIVDKIEEMHYGFFYGYAVAELIWAPDGRGYMFDDIKVRKQSRFAFDGDARLRLRSDWGNPEGELMPDRKFWTMSATRDHGDNPYGIGLAHWCYWPVFFKRNGLRFWSIFLEKFGMPTAVGKFGQNASANDQQKLLGAVARIQSEAGIIIPDGMNIDLIEASRGGTASYDKLYDRMNEAISKAILSQTMTTDDGASLSQSQVHQDVANYVVDSDGRRMTGSFDRGPGRWFTQINFPGATPPRLRIITEDDEDLDTRSDRDKKLFDMGYQLTPDAVRRTYGEDYEPKQQTARPPSADPRVAEFAAPSDLITPDGLDQLVDMLGDSVRGPMADWLDHVRAALDTATDAADFQTRLLALTAELPQDELADLFRQALVAAHLKGQLDGAAIAGPDESDTDG